MSKIRRSRLWVVILGFFITVSTAHAQTLNGRELTIRGDRWLTVTNFSGKVELISAQGERQAAQRGARLVSVGDTIVTGPNSSARLEIDQSAGFVSMAENSQMRIQTLSITSNGGRITELAVLLGQVRLRIRRLTNPDTRIEIHTPAGVSGVRGTTFGVTVQSDGFTGVATLEGSVITSAQNETVMVIANTQSFIVPGEPPTPPAPLRDDPTLFIEGLSEIPETNKVSVVGYTDSVNLLDINQGRQVLDREGRFNLIAALTDDRRVEATITTPLGTTQNYILVVP